MNYVKNEMKTMNNGENRNENNKLCGKIMERMNYVEK